MSRSIDFTKAAQKFVERLDQKQKQQILSRIAKLRDDPDPHDSRTMQNATPPAYRLDCGEYRVIYRYDEMTIYVLLVGKRNDADIYKKFKRL